MKRAVFSLVIMAMCLSLCSCTNSNANNYNDVETTETESAVTDEISQIEQEAINDFSSDSNEEETASAPNENEFESPNQKQSSTTITTGEKNALQSAKDYLNYLGGFSYEGLVEQLEFEGYTHSEAVYAADNCGADWKEQAAIKAKQYLDVMSFSRQGLIEQLEFEGFTYGQAVYGVEQNGY